MLYRFKSILFSVTKYEYVPKKPKVKIACLGNNFYHYNRALESKARTE